MKFQNFKKVFCDLLFPYQFLSQEECEMLIDFFETNIAFSESSKINQTLDQDTSIRSSRSMFIAETLDTRFSSIIQRIGNNVYDINNSHWQFKLSSEINNFQIIKYQTNDHYDWHVDWNPDPMCCNRKISVVIQLSDENDYSGCDLILKNGNSDVFFKRQRGFGVVFPSFVLHKVTPLISGTRYSLVFWIEGDSFQ